MSKSLLERTWAAASALITEAGHPENEEDRPMIVVDRALYTRLWETMHGGTEPEPAEQSAGRTADTGPMTQRAH